MLAVNLSYFKKRRALFTPPPEWLAAGKKPLTVERVYTPKENHLAEQASGYSTIYRDTEYMSSTPVAVVEMEPENGVELLMKLQAEAGTEAPIDVPPVKRPERSRGKGAPIWSMIALGTLCVVLAVTVGVVGWQVNETGRQKHELSAQVEILQRQVDALQVEASEKDEEALALKREHSKLKGDYSDLFTEYSDALYYQNFLSNYIGFIVEGSNRYHTVDCSIYQSADEYLAHNVEYCVYLGYSKCPLCGEE